MEKIGEILRVHPIMRMLHQEWWRVLRKVQNCKDYDLQLRYERELAEIAECFEMFDGFR